MSPFSFRTKMSRFFKKTDKLQIESKPHIGPNYPNIADTIRSAQSKNPPAGDAFGSTASSSAPPNIVDPNEQMENDSTAQPPTGRPPPRRQRRNNWMSSTVSIGQDQAYNEVCNFLKDDEVGMVGIYGMGGVGKTTLMKKIDREFLKPSYFKVIWVVVSKTVDMDGIQEVIMRNLNPAFNKHDDPYSRGEQINGALRNNKVAILFDDIWECLDLEKLGLLGPQNLDTRTFKLIFTTRSEAVCEKMQSDELIKVEPLGWDDSWALFKRSVGSKSDIETCDASIVELAKEVAKECKGLPLALKVIGRAMAWRRRPEEWRDALATLRLYPAEIDDAKKDLFTPLKFSFDSLSNPREKGCFLYTCFYPEDTEIEASLLIECWIGEGILTLNGSYQEALDKGMNIFRTLQAACLFETLHGRDDEDLSMRTRIHDVIRDMGIWIAESHDMISLPTYSDDGISRTEKTETHRFSVWYENSKVPEEASRSNLTTLIIRSQRINFSCFASMSQLRVIKLRYVHFDGIPTSIGELTELRHLEIIGTNLERLPDEIRNLRKLQVMRCGDCRHRNINIDLPEAIGELDQLRILVCGTKTLPTEIGNLHKLEELEIYITKIEELPKIIGQLTELRKLDIAVHYYCRHTLPVEVGNLTKLEVLCIHSRLAEFPRAIGQLVSLKKLVLATDGRIELPTGLGNLNKLEIFEIRSVLAWGCVELITGDTFRNMHKLRELQLPIRNFTILPPSFSQGLTSLKSLSVSYKDKEEDIYDDVASFLTQLAPLPLTILRIESFPIKELQVPPTSNDSCFPWLEELYILYFDRLEKMQVMSQMALPSIRFLKITDSDSLKHISGLEHLQSLVALQISFCSKLEEVIQVAGDKTSSDQSPDICFPKLEKLRLTFLPQLKSICSDAISFPSLRDFRLDGCPELRVLPRGLVKENKAPEECFIGGGREWYDKLQWQDKDFKVALDPHLR